MGISGLLQFIKDASEPVNVKKYKGQTVAVDTYCWLHKGAFSCADKLAKGEPTDQYVWYCMKFVDMLLNFGVKPILVFDGRNLPSKKEVEKLRRERREANLQKGKQLLRDGKHSEARECFNRCVNITPAMAHNLIKTARSRGVDCIVAPYEADAQLAFLSKSGLAQAVITEDSDLLAFGCKRVILKMDKQGNGLEIDQTHLGRCKSLGNVFTEEKFRHMCILSGCDYLSSLHGIGLGKACKLLRLAKDPDILKVIKKMGQYLKMDLVVPDSYLEGFVRANNTFLYQLVFDPLQRRVVPLNPYPEHVDPKDLSYAGLNVGDEKGLQMALGNLDLNTMERIDDFSPDTPLSHVSKPRSRSWKDSPSSAPSNRCSIWRRDGSSSAPPTSSLTSSTSLSQEKRTSTRGQQRVLSVGALRLPCRELQVKRSREDSPLSEHDMLLQYSSNDYKRLRSEEPHRPSSIPNSSSKPSSGPGVTRTMNRFATVLQRRNQDSEEDTPLTCSRFFSSSSRTSPPPSCAHLNSPKPAPDLENIDSDGPEAPSVDTPSSSPQNTPDTASHQSTEENTAKTTASTASEPSRSISSRGQRLFHWSAPSSPGLNQSKPDQNWSSSGLSALKRFQFKKENVSSSTTPPSPVQHRPQEHPEDISDSPPSQDSAYFSQSQPSASSDRQGALYCSQPNSNETHSDKDSEADLSPTERTPSAPRNRTPGLSHPNPSQTHKPRSLGPARASGLKRKPGSNKPGLNNENSPSVQATISGLWKNFSFKK